MIIAIDDKEEWRTVRRMSWKTKFKLDLIKRNNQAIRKFKEVDPILQKKQQMADTKFLQIPRSKLIEICQTNSTSKHHSYYSSYVPLKSHYPVGDQYSQNFPYLRYLEQNSRNSQKIEFYIEISNDLKEGKETLKVVQKWQQCFDKFLPKLNVLDAIDCYLELSKHGTKAFRGMYKKKAGNCKKQIFFHRICQTAKYFKENPKIRKQLNVSIQTGELINEMSLAKTSKNLMCAICFLYDCGLHKVDDNVMEKNYQYISPRNAWKEEDRVYKAIQILRFFSLNLDPRPTIPQSSEIPDTSNDLPECYQSGKICSQQDCYLLLNKDKYKRIQFQRLRFLSPVVKSFMKMGIEIFSYDPCKIWKLFPPEKQKKMTCSIVFLYLIEEYNIRNRLELKFHESLYSLLLNEKTIQTAQIISNVEVLFKKKSKISGQHNFCGIKKIKQKSAQIATCYHYFIGQEPTDLGCSLCSCRERGFCLPQCLCSPSCPIMKIGCNCKGDKDQCRNRKCSCFISKFECQPGICANCFDCPRKHMKKKNGCYNNQILRGIHKMIRIGPSTISGAGLGAFAGEFIEADSLVSVYSGQVIEHEIDATRQLLSRDLSFYNFGSPNGTIDARYMGNKSRFVNHANDGRENIRAVVMFSQGCEVVSFYAQRDISKGQELFFDYDGQGDLQKNFKDKYPFIQKKKI